MWYFEIVDYNNNIFYLYDKSYIDIISNKLVKILENMGTIGIKYQ